MRFCHACDSQFPDEHARCLHCGEPLHDARATEGSVGAGATAGAGPDAVEAEEGGARPPLPAPTGELSLLTSLPPYEAPALLERLADEEIAFAVADETEIRALARARGLTVRPGLVHVVVAEADRERASAVQQAVLMESLHDLPEDFDPTAGDPESCPACATPLAADASECAECGLEFPESGP